MRKLKILGNKHSNIPPSAFIKPQPQPQPGALQ